MGPGYGISKRLGIKPEPNEYTGILILFAIIFLLVITGPYWASHIKVWLDQSPREQKEVPRGKYYMPKTPTTSGLRSFSEPFKRGFFGVKWHL